LATVEPLQTLTDDGLSTPEIGAWGIRIRKAVLTSIEVDMAQDSPIEWTDSTWNPVTGCTKISPGCKNCYAHRMARRLHAMGQARYRNNFAVTLQPDVLEQPLRWSHPRKIFVNSMSDLFHPDVPLDFISRVFDVMGQADWHTFQILTKRSERLAQLANKLPWNPNIWMGVSVENADYTFRINDLRRAPAAVRFLSVEPLLGPIPRLPLQGIHWVIVGGESGPGARNIDPTCMAYRFSSNSGVELEKKSPVVG
jgi:protein gp37